jgi:ATP-dependent RNA helicase DDX41
MEVVKPFDPKSDTRKNKVSLLEESRVLKKIKHVAPDAKEDEKEKEKMEEEEILNAIKGSALMTVKEKAALQNLEPLKTTWRAPRDYRFMNLRDQRDIRNKQRIFVEGEDLPAPIKSFKDFRFPKAMLEALADKGVLKPTPIQMQGLPAVLTGRDFIGIAFTGSGKTLVFILPLVMMALEEEKKMPVLSGEGPFGLVVLPSHELAIQTFEIINFFCDKLYRKGYPRLRTMLCIGGMDMKEQMHQLKRGLHIVVGTPGRLSDMLNKNKFNLEICRYLVLDEADRLLDVAFEEEIRNIMEHIKSQRQTLLFSATMPKKIQEFAKSALIKPIVVNIGRAGAANLDVRQEVEYVKEDQKLAYLIECLKKTGPPVLMFCENKNDVDDIHGFLLSKGIDAAGLHGGKSQEDRARAIQDYKSGKKDVLVATDVAAKGLDFPDIKHVVNYDMPKDIESYVHRIGRTGRSGKGGLATTFINRGQDPTILLDLKHLLIEAKQEVPPFLKVLKDPEEKMECAFCGGLGHKVTNCNKLEGHKMKALVVTNTGSKDVLTQGSRYGGAGFGGET